MNIRILQLIDGARQAEGLTVIIDVFRAFSVACYVANNGAARIIPVGSIEEAYRLKRDHPEWILMGERGGIIQPGFDYGNSPTHLEHVDFSGKTVVHTTSAGTQGIVNAVKADEIITGSFVNAEAIVEYIRRKSPKQVTLVCMGWGGTEPADEDTLCAEHIRNALEGMPNDFNRTVTFLREESKTGSFLDVLGEASEISAPASDFELCLAVNRFDFVLRVAADPKEENLLVLKKIQVS
jgi:2-phosphosulfolactate phosphatase